MPKIKDPETGKFISKEEAEKRGLDKGLTFNESFAVYCKDAAKREGCTPQEYAANLLNQEFMVVEFSEATGKASLSIFPAATGTAIKDMPTDKLLAEYKDLRENFAPVSAGIEYHKTFLCGSGLNIICNDPRDKHKIQMRDECRELARKIYMDYYRVGLDKLLFILSDPALTYGASAAIIAYKGEVKKKIEFMDFTTVESVGTKQYYRTRLPSDKEWKSFKGMSRLKIIDDAVSRLIPVFHERTQEFQYWLLDSKKAKSQEQAIAEKVGVKAKEEGIKLLPFQVLWLSWNTHNANIRGESIIRPALEIARLVRRIQKAVGKGFDRWAEKKYFFVCGTEKRPWNKQALRKFLKYLQLMIKHHWTGIPVPQGFKVEEIGGEVFEGTNIIGHLIDMICAAMNYPRDFLERGRSRAGDKAWLAWQVKYGSNQRLLRRDIEHQLFEKHLWCTFGKTYRVKKQNTEPRKREKRDTYVPKIIWNAEGRWQKKEEIETLLSALNVANPIGPEEKLAIERRLAELFGFGDIEFPSFDAIRKEIRLENKLRLMILQNQIDQAKLGPVDVEEKGELSEEEKQKRRLEGGVSLQKTKTGEPTGKGKSKDLGKTRKPKTKKKGMPPKFGEGTEESVKLSVRENVEESVRKAIAGITFPAIPIDINIKTIPTDPSKVEVDVTLKATPLQSDITITESKESLGLKKNVADKQLETEEMKQKLAKEKREEEKSEAVERKEIREKKAKAIEKIEKATEEVGEK